MITTFVTCSNGRRFKVALCAGLIDFGDVLLHLWECHGHASYIGRKLPGLIDVYISEHFDAGKFKQTLTSSKYLLNHNSEDGIVAIAFQ